MTDSNTSAAENLPARKSSYDYEDLCAGARGDLFGMANGKLPAPPMLMTDRIALITDDSGKYGKG